VFSLEVDTVHDHLLSAQRGLPDTASR